ncbi:MAG: OmpA family protein [Novosphingobium sp.]|nr:OmpA family protein [Novosphingobium sp.]
MTKLSHKPGALVLLAALSLPLAAPLAAQTAEAPQANSNIVVSGIRMPAGPDVKGIIAARNEDKIKVVAADGTASVITVNDETKIKASGGLFGGGAKLGADALLNGLPVTVKTKLGEDGVLFASQITFKNGDLKTARMIRQGTEQQFAEQTAATEALRGRMADIDKYNIKGTTNVFFDTGKWALTPQAKNELCTAASSAEGMNNAMILVVGYTDSVGSEEYNQVLSERRAGAVINYLQQYCRWKPYRMLTPTGMAEADPLADNSTEEGKAQNRRVSVNVLVSKGLDGM